MYGQPVFEPVMQWIYTKNEQKLKAFIARINGATQIRHTSHISRGH